MTNLFQSLLLRPYRRAWMGIAAFSAVINLLMLTGAIYMLEVYDRVLPSRSVQTLIALSLIVCVLYLMQALLDFVRNRIFIRIAGSLDETVAGRAYATSLRLAIAGRDREGSQALRDLEQVRSFLAGGGPSAFFDLPWIPLYLAICFAFHFWIGIAAALGAATLIALTLVVEHRTRTPMREATQAGSNKAVFSEMSRRNAEAVTAMGLTHRLSARFTAINSHFLDRQQEASDAAGGLLAISKALRMMLQSAVLGVGAWLVIQQEATPGIIIAGSILSARALAPVDLAIANWKGFQAARQGWTRLQTLLGAEVDEPAPLTLPAPRNELVVENVTITPPHSERKVVQDVSFRLTQGSAIGIVGPSGSGKSSIARALVGVWTARKGSIRLDGAELALWASEARGQHIGYLPQDVSLIQGTIGENICRFDPDPKAEQIIEAASNAGVHELILRLPKGYETDIGVALSAGQRQRIALARALYGEPFLVVLDEPNSNLDEQGEAALTNAILRIRERGGVAVVIAHRPSVLAAVDQVMIMSDGRIKFFGPKDRLLLPRLSSRQAGSLAVAG